MQQILYGSTLTENIKVDVIGQKLWQGLPKKPDIVFVDSPDLFPIRRIVGAPTALLANSQADPSSLSTLQYDVGPHPADQGAVGQIVVALEGTCNLIEPFIRIRQALTEAQKAGG